jgi:hypothetical protein
MAITIDCREPLDVIEAVQDVFGEENVEIKLLKTADFVFADDCHHIVGIERKTPDDLLNSFASGRLQTQLNRLLKSFHVPILLIAGHYGIDPPTHKLRVGNRHTGWHNSAVQMALYSLQTHGIRVLYAPYNEMAPHLGLADTLHALYKRGQPPQPKCLVRHDDAGVRGHHLPEGLVPGVGRPTPRVQQPSRVVLVKERPYSPARGDSLGEKPPSFTIAGPQLPTHRSRTGRILKERAVQRDRTRTDARSQPRDGELLDNRSTEDAGECEGVA